MDGLGLPAQVSCHIQTVEASMTVTVGDTSNALTVFESRL